jgi:hypothetical protein
LLRQKVYLFLKDLVHTRADLAAQRVAIHRYVVDRVGDTVRQSFFLLFVWVVHFKNQAEPRQKTKTSSSISSTPDVRYCYCSRGVRQK